MNIYHDLVYLITYRLVNVVSKYNLFLIRNRIFIECIDSRLLVLSLNIINLLCVQNIQREDFGRAPLWRATKLRALQ